MHSSIEGHFCFLSIVTRAVMNITEGQSVNRMSSLVLGFLLLYWNTMGKRNWRGKDLFCLHLYITLHDQRKSGQQVKQGRGWQELMKRLWRCAADWFARHGLVNLFLRGSKPGMAPPAIGWYISHESLTKKMSYSLVYTFILRKRFLNSRSLLSDDFSLSQVEMKLSSASSSGICQTMMNRYYIVDWLLFFEHSP